MYSFSHSRKPDAYIGRGITETFQLVFRDATPGGVLAQGMTLPWGPDLWAWVFRMCPGKTCRTPKWESWAIQKPCTFGSPTPSCSVSGRPAT